MARPPGDEPPAEDADRLYGLPLAEFVAARDLTARRLRKAGQRDAGAAVAALRKPNAAAWAVNQLVRRNRDGVEVLVASGDAFAKALERGDAAALRAATAAEREAVDALADEAVGLLRHAEGTVSDAVGERIRSTLHAAVVDDASRAAVLGGRVTADLQDAGLGSLGGNDPQRAPAPAPPPAAEAAPSAAERKQRARLVKERRAAAREARAALRAAERTLEQSERAAVAAARESAAAAAALQAARAAATEAARRATSADEALGEVV